MSIKRFILVLAVIIVTQLLVTQLLVSSILLPPAMPQLLTTWALPTVVFAKGGQGGHGGQDKTQSEDKTKSENKTQSETKTVIAVTKTVIAVRIKSYTSQGDMTLSFRLVPEEIGVSNRTYWAKAYGYEYVVTYSGTEVQRFESVPGVEMPYGVERVILIQKLEELGQEL